MATYTTYYNLKKPQATDTTEIITDLNANYDTIDTALNGKASTTHADTHITGGTDIIPNAVPGGNSGLMSGADKQNLDDAVAKKHEHTNKDLLDSYTQTNTNIADAISKKHSQNTDQYLDFGGNNEISAEKIKNLSETVVNIKDYGAVGDGVTDDTTAFINAVTAARALKSALILPPGSYVVTPTSTIDLTGIPALIGYGATLDMSGVSISRSFQVVGTKTKIAENLTLTKGAQTITLSSGLELKRGTTLLITSIEDFPHRKGDIYRKGERITVTKYNNTTGETIITPSIRYNYTASAYVWKLTESEIYIPPGLTIVGPIEKEITCMIILWSKATIGCTLKNWGGCGISTNGSETTFYGKIFVDAPSDTGTSYGITGSDFSRLSVIGAHISGGRHAVANGGGGVWNDLESGGTDKAAVFPTKCTVNGGTYSCSSAEWDVGAIDGHANADLIITGAVCDGGIKANGPLTAITNCQIEHRNYGVICAGGTADNNDFNADPSSLIISNNIFRGKGGLVGSAIYAYQHAKTVVISGNTMTGEWKHGGHTSDSPIRISGKFENITIESNTIYNVYSLGSGESYAMWNIALECPAVITIKNNLIRGSGITLKNDNYANVTDSIIAGNIILESLCPARTIQFNTPNDDKRWRLCVIENNTIIGGKHEGLQILDGENIIIRNNIIKGNNLTATGYNMHLRAMNAVISGNDLRKHGSSLSTVGFRLANFDSSQTVQWSHNDLRGYGTVGYTIVTGTTELKRRANVADSTISDI